MLSRPDDSARPLPGTPGDGTASRMPSAPDADGAPPAAPEPTAPAVKPPRWSGRKTAVAAALATTART